MTYAGRLDPLAEGALILLSGNALREKNKYLDLDKEYEAEILFEFKTDSFDILGIPYKIKMAASSNQKNIKKLFGDFEFFLPPYSSFKIKGRPLFWWARKNKLNEIEIPKRKIKIYDIKILDSRKIDSTKLLKKQKNKLRKRRL